LVRHQPSGTVVAYTSVSARDEGQLVRGVCELPADDVLDGVVMLRPGAPPPPALMVGVDVGGSNPHRVTVSGGGFPAMTM
jgi:hypothetical protein